jgi:putative Holliday junction resolvase
VRYLGLDLGTKTLGVAITDKTNTISTPLKTIRFNFEDYESSLDELSEIINKNNITEIALGIPRNMDGSYGFAADRSLKYKEMLENKFNINITLIDERLTSIEAHNILSNNGKKEKEHKKNVDAVAATLILDTFLKRKVSNNE